MTPNAPTAQIARELIEKLLFIRENVDETGYVEDVGFYPVDDVMDEARRFLAAPAPTVPPGVDASPTGREHDLKVWPEFYDDVESDTKPFEARLDDRDFQVGDVLLLREYHPLKVEPYTGRSTRKLVTYKLTGGKWGVEKGHCILGLKSLKPTADAGAASEGAAEVMQAEQRIDAVFDQAFGFDEEPMLDWVKIKFELKRLRKEAAQRPKDNPTHPKAEQTATEERAPTFRAFMQNRMPSTLLEHEFCAYTKRQERENAQLRTRLAALEARPSPEPVGAEALAAQLGKRNGEMALLQMSIERVHRGEFVGPAMHEFSPYLAKLLNALAAQPAPVRAEDVVITPPHSVAKCGRCGKPMLFNVPRLGPDGGFVHAATGKLECEPTASAPAQSADELGEAVKHARDIINQHYLGDEDVLPKDLDVGSTAFKSVYRWINEAYNLLSGRSTTGVEPAAQSAEPDAKRDAGDTTAADVAERIGAMSRNSARPQENFYDAGSICALDAARLIEAFGDERCQATQRRCKEAVEALWPFKHTTMAEYAKELRQAKANESADFFAQLAALLQSEFAEVRQ